MWHEVDLPLMRERLAKELSAKNISYEFVKKDPSFLNFYIRLPGIMNGVNVFSAIEIRFKNARVYDLFTVYDELPPESLNILAETLLCIKKATL